MVELWMGFHVGFRWDFDGIYHIGGKNDDEKLVMIGVYPLVNIQKANGQITIFNI
jgi:hypothetical protein